MTLTDRKTILLVEDDGLIALDKSQAIKEFGYEVAAVDTGEEAVDFAVKNPKVALVLMDLDLGAGFDGSEAARRILEKRRLPIVFFTAHSGSDYVDRVKNLEHFGYVLKNSGNSVLRDSLETAFRLFHAQVDGIRDDFPVPPEYPESGATKTTIRENEESYRRFFETMPEGFSLHEVLTDKDGRVRDFRFLDCNAAYERHTGLKRADCLGRTMLEINPAADKLQIERYGQVALTGEPFCFEYESKTFNRFFHVCAFRPSPGRFAAVFEDVTDLKNSETALRAARERIQGILASLADIYIFLDNNWIFLDLNKQAEAVLRKKRSDLIGKKYWDVFPQVVRSEINKNLNAAMYERIPVHFEEYSKAAEMWGELHVYPCDRGLEFFIRDINERKRIELRHQEIEEKYQALFNTEFYAICTADAETLKILDANKTFADLYGYSREELLQGMTLHDFSAEVGKTDDTINVMKAEGRIHIPLRYHRKKNGQIFPVEISGCVFERKGSKVISSILADISERKAAEESKNTLLKEKDLILREVHHRIKNNMVTMMSFLSLQSTRMKNPETAEALLEAQNRLRSMGVLYDKLYRSESQSDMSVRAYLEPLLDDIVKLFPHAFELKVVAKIEDFTLNVKDLASLGIVVNELVTNTLKYAFAGRNEGMIALQVSKEGKRIIVVFEDDGIGLPESVDAANPAGFGFLLVNALVKQLKGSLRIERRQGTRFVLEFES